MKNIFMNYWFLVPAALFLGLSPFLPEPHLSEKLRMFIGGTLRRPIDILDVAWHSWPVVLLGILVGRDIGRKIQRK